MQTLQAPATTSTQAVRRPRLRRALGTFQTDLLQLAASYALALGVPFLAYAVVFLLGRATGTGLDLSGPAFWVVATGLLATSAAVTTEGVLALRSPSSPRRELEAGRLSRRVPLPRPFPPAAAVIAAYLPNEAETIVAAARAHLALTYPGPLQVVVAYNRPDGACSETVLAAEVDLRRLAAEDARVVPLRVLGSTSKAENVNYAVRALHDAPGGPPEFVGIFDADHHPDADAFTRAWERLSSGPASAPVAAVQGRCAVRNGTAGWLAQLVAVEFEILYGIAHPGRARLGDFGIFGGSNGYWRREALGEMPLDPGMLTEDIDATVRALVRGRRVISDPHCVSRELAPLRPVALLSQRLRWAQGWFQVALAHLGAGLRSPHLPRRRKLGLLYVLGWCQLYPWLSLQMVPLLAFWAWRDGPGLVAWHAPLLALTALTTAGGPLQILLAYRQARPGIGRQAGWFLAYLVLAMTVYGAFKNAVARTGQLKHLLGEREWRVTPRG